MDKHSKSYKVQIQIGYNLVETYFGEERYFWPGEESNLFVKPFAVNSYNQIKSLIVGKIKGMDKSMKIRYPSSSWKMKYITRFKVLIYYRDHRLVDDVEIPKYISENKYVINFTNTENKCIFYCIGYHKALQAGIKHDPNRMVAQAKSTFANYCCYKKMEYSVKLYKDFDGVDIIEIDELEKCYKFNINVFQMDLEDEIKKIRQSKTDYPVYLNILDYKGHALYITDKHRFLGSYECSKCGLMFKSSTKLRDHKKNQCNFAAIESFVKEPVVYQPPKNRISGLLKKYHNDNLDHFIDHFIVFDFEVYQKKIEYNTEDKTIYTHDHIPISVSICNSLTREIKCIIDESPRKLIKRMFEYVHSIQEQIYEANINKFEKLTIEMLKAEGVGLIAGESIQHGYSYNDISNMVTNKDRFTSWGDFFLKQCSAIVFIRLLLIAFIKFR